MNRYKRLVYQLLNEGRRMKDESPPVNSDRAEQIMLRVASIRRIADDMARLCHERIVDSQVEPGPEGRAAFITESESGGVRQIVAGPKTTEKSEVVS